VDGIGVADGAAQRLVRLARTHLSADAATLWEIVAGQPVCRAADGDPESFGYRAGESAPEQGTFCGLLAEASRPMVVPDCAEDPRVRELPATLASGIGSYVGAPLYLPGGVLYGSICAVTHLPRADLDDKDGRLLSVLGELVADELAVERVLRTERDAIAALGAADLRIALQPVASLSTGRCLGLEALARFPAGLGVPAKVFETAERVGLRSDVERLAMTAAIAAQRDAGHGQWLATNVSPDLAPALLDELAGTADVGRLVVEITEHAAVRSYRALRERLDRWRGLGLRIAVDDAGAGFSSMRHILELRPDIIKIDRSLVAGIESDARRRSVLTSFVTVAAQTGGIVVAEGVETPAELSTVSGLGADAAQGYLLARPSLRRADVEAWSETDFLAAATGRPADGCVADGPAPDGLGPADRLARRGPEGQPPAAPTAR
jgi:EAL domain-containing protein (putative c-di-GMP-specific phosphodiesterase class I)